MVRVGICRLKGLIEVVDTRRSPFFWAVESEVHMYCREAVSRKVLMKLYTKYKLIIPR